MRARFASSKFFHLSSPKSYSLSPELSLSAGDKGQVIGSRFSSAFGDCLRDQSFSCLKESGVFFRPPLRDGTAHSLSIDGGLKKTPTPSLLPGGEHPMNKRMWLIGAF